jgi:hypothetical protein
MNQYDLMAQTVVYETPLPKIIEETSGLEFLNQDLLTHNDSGGKPVLYRFNLKSELLQPYTIEGAENNDWEDMAQDENFIYISDSGNNKGNRKNLNLLIVDPKDNFATVGQISFHYRDQQNFDKRSEHPFDAEALIATEESLILFSKNRETLTTELYSLPKKAGNYSLKPQKSFDVQSLITGGDYHHKLQLVALVGYVKSGEQFLYTLSNFDLDHLNSVEIKKFKLPLDGKQIEAVKIIDHKTFWITSEDEGNRHPMLYKIQI